MKPRHVALALAGFQAIDAVVCAIPLPIIKRDLDRLGCSEHLQRTIPAVKGLSVLGLLVGLRVPRLGRTTTVALVGYFTCAVAFHTRAHDHPIRSAPAAGAAVWALTAKRAYRT